MADQRPTQRWTIVADVAEGYASLASLTGSSAFEQRLVEGVIQALDGAIYVRFQTTRPEDSEDGVFFAVEAGLGIGPVYHRDAGWGLDEIWVRRADAGVAARVTGVGVVQ